MCRKDLEYNRIIAEYMGIKMKKGNIFSMLLGYPDKYVMVGGDPKTDLGEIPYNKKWEYIMPVARKLISLRQYRTSKHLDGLINALSEADISWIHTEVTEFITYLNMVDRISNKK